MQAFCSPQPARVVAEQVTSRISGYQYNDFLNVTQPIYRNSLNVKFTCGPAAQAQVAP